MATLFVVATPIGNLQDLSPRAAQVLKDTPVIAAESLTRTKKLLSHLGLRGKRLVSCREANRKLAAVKIREALDQGLDVALVSDAGTPGLSDPGGAVVAAIAQSGHRISPVAGPSALAAAVSVAGWPGAPFVFLGFLPAKPGARRRLLERARDTGWPFAFFEGPHRLADTARDLAELMGERKVVLARELSKVNEEVVHTTCEELAGTVKTQGVKGEITLLVAGGEPVARHLPDMDELLRQGLRQGAESPSRLAKRVAAATGQPREQVYRRLLVLKEEPAGRSAQRITKMSESGKVIEKELAVKNGLGLHARVAARIAETLKQYDCEVTLSKDGLEADGDSVLSILTLDAPAGSRLVARARGAQAEEALAALEGLFAEGFGED